MYLKRLDIQGFKSFADKTTLEFRPGVTAVIGPNGSGKSNVSDSVRWVLGEQSMKSLRGSKSHDIIFAGTENRRQLGFAEVNLTMDNSSGLLPVSYDEVTVTRRIYRSGDSEFYINKTPCRLKDIHELFMGTGVGRDGYSIIGQGRIDEILSNNSEERRGVFEEAAGIAKYKMRKQEAERKLDHTNQNLLRINDIIKEIETNLGPLKIQSEKASSFLLLRDELRDLEINIFIDNTDKINENLKNIDLHLAEIQEELEIKEKNSEELTKTKNELRDKINQIEVNFEKLQTSIFDEQSKIERLNSDINLANEKISNNIDNSVRFDNEIIEFQNKITALITEKENKLQKIDRLKENRKSYLDILEEKESELAKLITTLSEDEKKIEDIKTEIIEKMNLNSEKKVKLSSLNTMKSNADTRFNTIENEIREIGLSKDKARMLKEDIKDSISGLTNEKSALDTKISSVKNTLDNLKQTENTLKSNFDKLTSDITIKKSRYKFLSDTEKNHEGYFRSVKAILDECEKNKDFAKGIDGALAGLISVPKDYELAIETALGSSLNDIVTDTPETAKRAIEFLKNTKSGRATFLPISSMKVKKQDSEVKNFSGFIGIASDLINYDDKYSTIIASLLGRTIIVDNLDSAVKAAKTISSYRLISLEGDIINTSGTMSGGSSKHKNEGILSRNREITELKTYIEENEIKLKELNKELIETQKNITANSTESEALASQLQTLEISLFAENEKLSNLENEVNKLDQRTTNLNVEKEQLKMQVNSFLSDVEILEKEIGEADDFINSSQEKINEYKQNNETQMEIRDRLADDITDYKISLSSFDESISSVNEITERIDNDIVEYENSIKVRNDMKEANEKEVTTLKEKILSLKEDINQIESFILTNKTSLETLKVEKIEYNNNLGKLEDSIIENIKDIEDVKTKYNKTESKKVKFDLELENLNNKMWDDYQITYTNALEMKKDFGDMNIQSRVNTLKAKIRDLGSINIDAIEEYKQLNERFEFLSTQRNDLEEAEAKLQKVITDMTAIMKKEFLEQFQLINKNFSEVFAELFGGGKAEISLTDENNVLESGIEIEVQPPGKKLQSMSLLSGGERAFTAIALLFAILKINPSPFCILDEIEAALDDVNVYRFADYIKKFSDTTQFILITHRKGTMESANSIYGVTMEEKGISKLVSMKIE